MRNWILLTLFWSACTGGETGTPAPNTSSAPCPETCVQPESAPAESNCEAHDDLEKMDQRTPVPLQPMMAWHQKQNMMEHLVAIRRINDGLARDDWEEVAAGSALIETSPQMQQMCQHMGAGAPGFTEMALDFHRRADEIGKAAAARDSKAVLAATAHTLDACTSCHSTYRQEVVDASTWHARTGSEHAPTPDH